MSAQPRNEKSPKTLVKKLIAVRLAEDRQRSG
jgi:hypothetical protein